VIRDLLRTGLTFGTVAVITPPMGTAAAAASFLDRTWANPIIRAWARSILSAAAVRHRGIGLENVPRAPAVFVANHQSNFDVPLISAYLEHLRFVAKAELFRIPLFGRVLKAVGMVRVDRKGTSSDRQALGCAADQVRGGVSLMFFPEGTRRLDGVLRPFKKGAAVMAVQAQVPIVPMAVAGANDIMPKHSRHIRAGRSAVLVVGEPISSEGLTLDDRDVLTERVRAEVARLYRQGLEEIAA